MASNAWVVLTDRTSVSPALVGLAAGALLLGHVSLSNQAFE